MFDKGFFRSLSGAVLSCLMAAAILTGCSDNTTGPADSSTDPVGNNSTVNVSDPVSASEANDVRANVQKTSNDTVIVSVQEASDIAIKEYPNGEVVGLNLDYDRDSLNYEVIVRSNGKFYLVVVDPQDGSVKEKRELSNAHYTRVIVIRPTIIKVHQARDRAVRIIRKAECVEVNLEEIDDRPTYVIVLLTNDNRYVTMYIDAETGNERKLKDDGKCEYEKGGDDDDDDKDRVKKEKKRKHGHHRHGHKGHGYGHHYHCHCECDDDDGGTDTTGVDTTGLSARIISRDSARVVVGTMLDSVQITKMEVKVVDTAHVYYEIQGSRDSNRYEIKLDAFTGSVIEVKQTAGNFQTAEFRPRVKGDTLVALSAARTAALAQAAGVVQSWKLEYDKTEMKWVYTFDIKLAATNEQKQVLVDAKTGTFMRIK